jgi:ABA DEFICIENT 4-like
MTPDLIFTVANAIAMISWVLLALLPRQRWVTNTLTGTVVPALLATLYIAIVAATFGRSPGGFSTLPAVATLFSNPWLLLAGWIHYLAFDLLVGNWEVRDARERGIPHALVVPCLLLTFLFGPAGWLLYLGVRLRRTSGSRLRTSGLKPEV